MPSHMAALSIVVSTVRFGADTEWVGLQFRVVAAVPVMEALRVQVGRMDTSVPWLLTIMSNINSGDAAQLRHLT
jgi:hypothetical protein